MNSTELKSEYPPVHRQESQLASPPSAIPTSPTAQVIALSEFAASPPVADAPGVPTVLRSTNPLHQVKARLQVCVGSATITVGELLAAREQQVIQLDSEVTQPVDLLLEGQVVARGQLVAVGDHFAVRITELPVQLGLEKPQQA